LVTIDTKAYILRMIVDILNYYLLFVLINYSWIKKKKFLLWTVFIPITFFVQIYTNFADFIPVVSGYLIFKTKKRDYELLGILIMCALIMYIESIISSSLLIFIFTNNKIKDFRYISIQIIIDAILILLFSYFYKKFQVNEFIKKSISSSTTILLIYLYVVNFFISYAAHYYKAFDRFILGIFCFLVVQTVFVLFLIVKAMSNQKKIFNDKFNKQELKYLKKYTEHLEKNQEKLSKFRHDYKNLLLSLKEIATINENNELFTQINQLEKYSDQNLENIGFDYNYFRNIDNNYIKSLLISKFYQANENGIKCKFECSEILSKVPIPIFDCVRILGIILDNAIESSKDSNKKEISMMIYQDEFQLEFLVINSCCDAISIPIEHLIEKGISTKESHEGLGLNTIQEINNKNNKMFVQYKKEDSKFTTQIILMW